MNDLMKKLMEGASAKSKGEAKKNASSHKGLVIMLEYYALTVLTNDLGASKGACVLATWIAIQKEVFKNRQSKDAVKKTLAEKGSASLPFGFMTRETGFGRKALIGYVKALESLDFIAVERASSPTTGNEANIYTLKRGHYAIPLCQKETAPCVQKTPPPCVREV